MNTIVLLHGWGSSAANMAPLAECLRAKGYRILARDFPGFGQAPAPEKPWTVDDYVAWFEALLAKEGVERPIIFAHSFGGRVAIKFAAAHLDRVERLILCGAAGIPPRLSWKRWMLKKATGVGKWWLKGATWEAAIPWPIRGYIEKKLARLDYFKAQGVMRETFKKVVQENLRPLLPKIKTPTLLVWGENDTLTPLRDAHIMEREIANAKLVIIPNADHIVYRTHPDEVADATITFLEPNTP